MAKAARDSSDVWLELHTGEGRLTRQRNCVAPDQPVFISQSKGWVTLSSAHAQDSRAVVSCRATTQRSDSAARARTQHRAAAPKG
jgi:hypothetical protein